MSKFNIFLIVALFSILALSACLIQPPIIEVEWHTYKLGMGQMIPNTFYCYEGKIGDTFVFDAAGSRTTKYYMKFDGLVYYIQFNTDGQDRVGLQIKDYTHDTVTVKVIK
jgi:hypothetical protein